MANSYSIPDYGAMIADTVRMDAYARALRQSIAPDATVLDVGTGTGVFAVMACRSGARRVYAIEPDDVIQTAREIAAASGCAGRIEFIQASSTEVSLPEPADVIVSDLAGALPWHGRHIPAIVDARKRLLAQDGLMIPRRDTAWAAVAEVDRFYERWMAPWDGRRDGIDLAPARRLVENTIARIRTTTDDLLTPICRWASLDYTRVEDPDVRASVEWRASRAGRGHGVVVGFDRLLAEGIEFSNAPDTPDAARATIYPQVFFPWPEPVTVEPGDRIAVTLEARLVRGEYIWNWNTEVLPERARGGVPRARFSQSTFYGIPLSPDSLRTRTVRD